MNNLTEGDSVEMYAVPRHGTASAQHRAAPRQQPSNPPLSQKICNFLNVSIVGAAVIACFIYSAVQIPGAVQRQHDVGIAFALAAIALSTVTFWAFCKGHRRAAAISAILCGVALAFVVSFSVVRSQNNWPVHQMYYYYPYREFPHARECAEDKVACVRVTLQNEFRNGYQTPINALIVDAYSRTLEWVQQTRRGARVVSGGYNVKSDGTFNFKPSQDNCDTIHVTFLSSFWGHVDDFYVSGLCALEPVIQIHSESRSRKDDGGVNTRRVNEYIQYLMQDAQYASTQYPLPRDYAQARITNDLVAKAFKNAHQKYGRDNILGLVSPEDDYFLPVTRVAYNVSVTDSLARVTLQQVYVNDLDKAITAKYLFSVAPEAAFVALRATFNGYELEGKITEKQAAQRQYEQAVKSGKTAAISQFVEGQDIMALQLGNLPAHSECTITFEYVQTLKAVRNRYWNLLLPSQFVPQREQDLSRAPPDTSIVFTLSSTSPVAFARSTTHQIAESRAESFDARTSTHTHFYAVTDAPNVAGGRDFNLVFMYENISAPRAILNARGATSLDRKWPYAAIITFVPDFETTSPAGEDFAEYERTGQSAPSVDNGRIRCEYIFVVDRSGSMYGPKLNNTKAALKDALRAMPRDSYFNIITFGTGYDVHFEESQYNTPDAIEDAFAHIDEFEADFGFSNLLDPLQYALLAPKVNAAYERNVFVITDGKVPSVDAIVKQVYCACSRSGKRVFTVGVGRDVDRELIIRTAEAGNGRYVFAPLQDTIKGAIKDIFADSVTPFVNRFKIDYNTSLVDTVYPHPLSIKKLTKNEPFEMFVFFKELPRDTAFTLSYYNAYTRKAESVTVRVDAARATPGTDVYKIGVHKMSKKIFWDAYYGNPPALNVYSARPIFDVDAYLTALSLKYQVLSDYTAFLLVVNEQDAARVREGAPNTRADGDNDQVQKERGKKKSVAVDIAADSAGGAEGEGTAESASAGGAAPSADYNGAQPNQKASSMPRSGAGAKLSFMTCMTALIAIFWLLISV